MDILVGTADGVHPLGAGRAAGLRGRAVEALATDGAAVWAIADGEVVLRDGEQVASSPDLRLNCLALVDGGVLAGASEARLLRLDGAELQAVDAFDNAPGRPDWYTPWGGPPDVRSVAAADDDALYVNVHVGGILRSTDRGQTWSPTIDIDADVHQVIVHPADAARVLAATAYGLADSSDGGQTWAMHTTGMHATYCRALAVAGDAVLISCSSGPRGARAAVYRWDGAAFERCRAGLPEWLDGNIDTGCLAAAGPLAVFGTEAGEVFRSRDAGRTWERAADGLPPVRSVILV